MDDAGVSRWQNSVVYIKVSTDFRVESEASMDG